MNWLAHMHCADLVRGGDALEDQLEVVGNLMGDFMHGIPLETLPAAVQRGVLRHRAIDRFTDAHPVFRRTRERLATPFRRWSGILTDVFYDHVLAKTYVSWSGDESLGDFTQRINTILLAHTPTLPGRIAKLGPMMAEQDWLGSYGDTEAVGRALSGMSRRARRENPLAEAVHELARIEQPLLEDFDAFYPDLLTFNAQHAPD